MNQLMRIARRCEHERDRHEHVERQLDVESAPIIIVVVVVFHTFCLGLLNRRVTRAMGNVGKHRVPQLVAMRVMGVAVLS
jgi:hypothetical protein